MSDETAAALYPSPPPFHLFFTDENVQQYKDLILEGRTPEEISQIKDIRFLIPPQQPDGETYRSFGDLWWFQDKVVGLKESGITQLYDDGDGDDDENLLSPRRIEQLKKLTQSLLINYLELLGIFAANPSLVSKKIEEIRIILINIHHLLNSYRLHQSREAMILNYQQKIQQTWDDVKKIKDTCDKVKSKIDNLQKLAQSTLDQTASNNGDVDGDIEMEGNSTSTGTDDNMNLFRKEALDALLN